MDSKYQPKKIERLWSSKWEESKLFSPSLKKNSKAFSIMLPPPNVTGVLHMGHGFQTSVMDSICRYKRMNGYDVLWQPGTDHAGISTEIVVERNLDFFQRLFLLISQHDLYLVAITHRIHSFVCIYKSSP